MQYEKLLQSKRSDPPNPDPLYFHSFFVLMTSIDVVVINNCLSD